MYCRNQTLNRWNLFDDKVVQPVNFTTSSMFYNDCKVNGYIMFYVKNGNNACNFLNNVQQSTILEQTTNFISNSSIIITPLVKNDKNVDFVNKVVSQNEDSSFSITENMKNISVLDDILDCDYDSEMEEDEDEKDDSKYWKTFTNDNNEEIKIFFFTSDEPNINSSCIFMTLNNLFKSSLFENGFNEYQEILSDFNKNLNPPKTILTILSDGGYVVNVIDLDNMMKIMADKDTFKLLVNDNDHYYTIERFETDKDIWKIDSFEEAPECLNKIKQDKIMKLYKLNKIKPKFYTISFQLLQPNNPCDDFGVNRSVNIDENDSIQLKDQQKSVKSTIVPIKICPDNVEIISN